MSRELNRLFTLPSSLVHFLKLSLPAQPSPAQPSLAVPASHREHKANFLLLSAALIKNLSGIDLWQLFVCFAETFAAARPGPDSTACAGGVGPGCCLHNFNPKLNEILCPRVFLFVVLVAGCGVWPAWRSEHRMIDAEFTLRSCCMSRPH